MKTIKGITKRQTINALKKYVTEDSGEYICKFLWYELVRITKSEISDFVEFWVKKFYGEDMYNNYCTGFFGVRYVEDYYLTRKAFVTLLIHELEK